MGVGERPSDSPGLSARWPVLSMAVGGPLLGPLALEAARGGAVRQVQVLDPRRQTQGLPRPVASVALLWNLSRS